MVADFEMQQDSAFIKASPSWPQASLPVTPSQLPQMSHFVSPLTFPSQPFYFGSPIILPPSQFSSSLPSVGNFTAQVPVSVPITPHSMPTPVVPTSLCPRLSSPTPNEAALGVNVAGEQTEKGTEVSSISPEPTDTVISIKNWVAVNLEADGECRIAGHSVKCGQLVCSERIIFVNYRGDIASDGKRLFKLCGPISWELYEIQHPNAGEINPTPQLRKAFSDGFPRKNRRNWLRVLYRFLYRLTQQKPNFRQSRVKSIAAVDEVGDADATNLETLDTDQRSDNTMDLPFLVLNSQTHKPRRKCYSPHERSDSSFPRKSYYSDLSGTESVEDGGDPIPSVSVLSKMDNNDFSTRGRQNPTWGGKVFSSSPLTVETGVQTSNNSPLRLVSASIDGGGGRRDVATETRRTRERTPLSSWMEKDMRLNVALRNADIECTPSPSPPSKTMPSTELRSHSLSRRRSEKEERVHSSSYSPKEPIVVDMDAQEFLCERDDGMVTGGSGRHNYPWKSKASTQSRRTPKHRFVKTVRKNLRSKEVNVFPSTSSTSKRKSRSQSREVRHKSHTLDRRHQLITHSGIVDVRDLRRTRSGRLSVPTRDTWHRQKIIFDGADISVDHGEYGKYFSSLIDD
ncbi:hypothetical protein TcWFU_001261 [Taenia crassiceps]|uniref:SANTA domain-containing protein n=1 Tax=Taenia crassiceps TaxID=6207 RepID=A0ABR4Q2S8_9CEST